MAKTRDTVQELPAQDVGFLFGTMFDLTTLPKELKHTGKVAKGEFKIVAHFPAIHAKNGTEAAYLARHRTFRGGLYATYQDGPYKIDEVNWDATNRAGVHMVTMTKYGQVVEFPSQPSKTMPGSLKLMVQELVESLKTPGFIIRCSGLGGALEPKKGTTDEYNVILLNGDVKCPKKLANHVPAKYHAEDESIFLAQTGPWCGNAEDYQKPPWIKGPGRKTRAMRSAKKQKNIELREKRNAEQMTQMGDSFFPVIPNTGGGDSALGSGRGVPQWYGAEETNSEKADRLGTSIQYPSQIKDLGELNEQAQAVLELAENQLLYSERNLISHRRQMKRVSDYADFLQSILTESQHEKVDEWSEDYMKQSGFVGRARSPSELSQFYGAEGEGDISHDKIDEETERPVILRHDYASTFYEWQVDGPVTNDQESDIEEQIKNEVGDSPDRGSMFFDFELHDDDRTVSVDTDTHYGEGRFYGMAAEDYGAESAFDKLANKVAQGYIKKGKSKKEALEIGRKTAYKIGVKKYGKAGMKRKSMEGRMRRKNAEEIMASAGYEAESFEAPMPFYSPSKGDVDRVQKAIRSRHQGIRFKGSPTYLTERRDGSNKYHVFQMTNRGGFNGYGRIGHTMSLFGPMSQQQYQSKLQSKMRKGYRETGF